MSKFVSLVVLTVGLAACSGVDRESPSSQSSQSTGAADSTGHPLFIAGHGVTLAPAPLADEGRIVVNSSRLRSVAIEGERLTTTWGTAAPVAFSSRVAVGTREVHTGGQWTTTAGAAHRVAEGVEETAVPTQTGFEYSWHFTAAAGAITARLSAPEP